MTPIIEHFAPLSGDYDILFCDVWGVVHNGVAARPAACDALARFRAKGGTVILLTNAPRPHTAVKVQLDRLAVPLASYDAIVTSGDVTRALIAARPGVPLLHVGPERDLTLFEGFDLALVAPESAGYIVCTGLWNDETETPEDYRAVFAPLIARGLELVCANPDRVVERGGQIIWCAGALADLYRAMGGATIDYGKPDAAIYDASRAMAERMRGAPLGQSRILAVGDAVRTDMEGAAREGLDALFVVAGIHAEDLDSNGTVDLARLDALLAPLARRPVAAMAALAW